MRADIHTCRTEVEDLQKQGFNVVRLHLQQHLGVDLVDVAEVRQLHDQAGEQRAVFRESQAGVLLQHNASL